jgi:hypothetical protein
LIKSLVHIKAVPEEMRLVTPAAAHALEFSLCKVVAKDKTVFGMGALLNDDLCSFLWTETADICETLLGNDNVQIVLSLIDVGAHRNNAGKAKGIGLRRTCGRCVHDAVLRGAEEIRRAAQTIQHTRAHYTSAICVGINIDFDWGVHANDTQSTDYFGRVGHLLGTEEELVIVLLPTGIEALETIRREADACCSGKVKTARVE